MTDAVGDRVRPDDPDSSDAERDVVIIELPDAEQMNCLSGEAIINGDFIVRTRSTDKSRAATIAEAVRINTGDNGLDGFVGTAGTGEVIQCERLEFSHRKVDDDDDDDEPYYETESLYSLWYQTN